MIDTTLRAATVMLHPADVPTDADGWRGLVATALRVFGEQARSYDGGVYFNTDPQIEPRTMVLWPVGFPDYCYLSGWIGGRIDT